MSVQTQIDRISGAVSDALAALTEKGVTVPAGTKVDGLAALIAAIEAGGGDDILMAGGTITPAENTNEVVVSHGLGVIPNFFLIFNSNMQSMRTKGAIKVMVVTPKSSFGTTHKSAFAATTQTQAYYQAFSYYRVNFNSITEGAPTSASVNARFTVDENAIHFYGTNHNGYSDYSEFVASEYSWLAVYNPNITYWGDFT